MSLSAALSVRLPVSSKERRALKMMFCNKISANVRIKRGDIATHRNEERCRALILVKPEQTFGVGFSLQNVEGDCNLSTKAEQTVIKQNNGSRVIFVQRFFTAAKSINDFS